MTDGRITPAVSVFAQGVIRIAAPSPVAACLIGVELIPGVIGVFAFIFNMTAPFRTMVYSHLSLDGFVSPVP